MHNFPHLQNLSKQMSHIENCDTMISNLYICLWYLWFFVFLIVFCLVIFVFCLVIFVFLLFCYMCFFVGTPTCIKPVRSPPRLLHDFHWLKGFAVIGCWLGKTFRGRPSCKCSAGKSEQYFSSFFTMLCCSIQYYDIDVVIENVAQRGQNGTR